MSGRRRVRLACALVVAALATACGADGDAVSAAGPSGRATSSTSGPAPSRPPLLSAAQRCPGEPTSIPLRPVIIERTGASIYALEAGTGPAVVVLVHGSGSRGLCVWTAELPWLSTAGFRVVAIDLPCVGNSTCPREPSRPIAAVAAVVASITADDPAARVAVVAASAGGPTAIHLAARPGSGITAAVALSPAGIEGDVLEGGKALSTVQAADRVAVPTLVVTSRDDRSVDQQTMARLRATGPADLGVEFLPGGSGHAQQLLYADGGQDDHPSPFRRAFLRFLAEHT